MKGKAVPLPDHDSTAFWGHTEHRNEDSITGQRDASKPASVQNIS